MREAHVSDARRRIVDLLKRAGPVTAATLATDLELSDVAVRQHLQGLAAAGLAESTRQAAVGRGRPSRLWSLSAAASPFFPDRHGELTVDLLTAIKDAFGEQGLERVILQRSQQQLQSYAEQMPVAGEHPEASLEERLRALVALRSSEGYLAELVIEEPASYLLIEHHCPICDAAKCCLGLCRAELEVFRDLLGPRVSVERTAHLLAGDARCIYRIRPQQGSSV